jgi:serine/threonine protein phosphatase 1
MKTFIIGDIHGCYDELIALFENASIKENDLILSLGDIVDRGPKSKEVYHFFKSRSNAKVLMGNHERKHVNNIMSYAQEIVKLQFGEEYSEFVNWTKQLDYYHETEEAIIIHAAFEHDKELFQQREDVLSGSTSGERYLEKKYAPDTFWSEYYKGEKPIIYGHHVVGDKIKIIGKTYGIDTGACHGGYLTAIELPGFRVHQVKSKKDYWEDEQKKWQIEVLRSKDWENMEVDIITKYVNKLSYIEDKEVRIYIENLTKWVDNLNNLLFDFLKKLEEETSSLMKLGDRKFTLEANKLPYNRFLFMCKSQKLTIDVLKKFLKTPAERILFAENLGLKNLIVQISGL